MLPQLTTEDSLSTTVEADFGVKRCLFLAVCYKEVWVKRTLKTNSVYLHLDSRGLGDSKHDNKYLYKYISAKRKALGIIILYIFLVSNVYSITTASEK